MAPNSVLQLALCVTQFSIMFLEKNNADNSYDSRYLVNPFVDSTDVMAKLIF